MAAMEDIIIIPHDSEKIIKIILQLHANPAQLKKIAMNGAKKIRKLYNYENQIAPRINIINSLLETVKR
jgi:spore maturation protein CgeB